jgi:hypothetical protein
VVNYFVPASRDFHRGGRNEGHRVNPRLSTVATAPCNKGLMTVFAQGGHLGNLSNPTVQKAILRALSKLDSSR